ncbi:hypothetical protein BTA51_06860 [Hahella sp. CCB-MM4]|uniref:PilZ domain-containing protein n=1 Tax=Hahella sp. (strain CCB-MM4) TaxID=1926491 RepID=UPI000B9B3BA8|nr:PilZ domain-containing protein [Hahella sp. CCB-MM4]OZG74696.1 hypothetical protein BTA51_06860 [Hahella sp. CCB-MM4]
MATEDTGDSFGFTEKRELPRLLCPPAFSNSLLEIGGAQYEADSINFNRNGLGIFVNGRLPNVDGGMVSFQFEREDRQLIEITGLPFELVYSNETEVGSQYGLKFETGGVSDDVKEALREIEIELGRQATMNRYGL